MVLLKNDFTAWDYVVFIGMLATSIGIGIYFAFKGDGQKTQGEYLMGGRSMSLVPVAISILVSFQSAILMLGTPAEMYTQGTEFFIAVIGQMMGFLMAGVLFVPLLYPLGFTSAFEYLEKRYRSRSVRLLGTFMLIIGQVMYMGIASFAPATALEAVTGFPVMGTLLIAGAVATFYTSIGGMKAVVWTDVFQAGVMLAGVLAIAIQGTIKANGIRDVWDVNEQWDRVYFFTLNPDPRVRHTLWGLTIGNGINWMITAGLNQASVQRYCTLPTLRQAKATTVINSFGIFVLFSVTAYCGVVMFAYYASQDCDPLREGLVDNSNQLIPYLVMDILAYPAVPGLFMSSLFSGALSSMSSSLNSLAAVTWEDALKPHLDHRLSELKKTVLLKVLVAGYGMLAVAMSYAVTFIEGTVVQAALSLLGPINGAVGGVFILGAFFPFANKYGAFAGGVIGMVISMWRSIGSYNLGIVYKELPSPNGTCGGNSSLLTTQQPLLTTTIATSPVSGQFDEFYKISYMWSAPLAIVSCVVPGLILSLATRGLMTEEERDVPTKYQIPLFRRLFVCLPESWLFYLDCCRSFENPEDISHQVKDVDLTVVTPEDTGPNKSSVSTKVENNTERYAAANGIYNPAYEKEGL